jgi:hypothetical protein
MTLIFYSWTALSDASGSSVAMGITDDRSRAMRAGEESLGSGRALVVIIEAVRPAMVPRTLAWLGQRTWEGEVTWNRFFAPADPDDRQAPGRMGP